MLNVEEQARPTNPTQQNRESAEAGLTIAVVAQMTGTTARALRYYESIGLLSPQRRQGKVRVYREADLRNANDIVHLRRLGFSVDDIAVYLGRISRDGAKRDILRMSFEQRLVLNEVERRFLIEAIRDLDAPC